MIIPNLHTIVKDIAGVFTPGGEGRATLESDLSAPSGPSGVSIPAFVLPDSPDGLKAINSGGEAEGEGAKPPSVITSLDTCKHLGIFEKVSPERDADLQWEEKRKLLIESQKEVAEVLKAAGRWSESCAVMNCSTEFHVFKAECCGDTIAIPHSCNHRLCPICMRRRSAELSEKIRSYIVRMRQPKFISLTFKNVERIDKAYFSWVRKCFTKLRHRKIFDKCLGGVYTIETTYNDKERAWHVHLHVVADIPFIPQDELSRDWKKITKVSFIVDIRKVGKSGQEIDEVSRELAKYVVKPDEFLLDSDLVNEYLDAVKRMRLVQAFGHCMGMELEEKEGFSWDCWCGENRWRLVGWYVPLTDIYRDKQGFYRLRGP